MGFLFGAFNFIRLIPWAYLPAALALYAWFAVMFRRSAAAAEREWAAETAGA
jgi:hypothetical protein